MGDTLLKILPVLLGFVGGFLLRRFRVAEQRDGDFLFRLVFSICLPALIFTSLSTVRITAALAVYPLSSALFTVVGFALALLVSRRTGWPSTQTAVMITGCMIANSGFELPFIQAVYGAEGVVRIAAFDAVNTALTFSWAYLMAARGNPNRRRGGGPLIRRLARSPALWAIALGAAVNLLGLPVPAPIHDSLAVFGSATAIIIPLAVGILFQPSAGQLGKAAVMIGVRLTAGLLVAVALIVAFDLQGLDRTIMLLLGIAPIGFSTVTFASLEKLDEQLAVTALSLSLSLSLVLSMVVTVI
jgi:predicted permease